LPKVLIPSLEIHLEGERPLFGEVASDSTAYRVIERIEGAAGHYKGGFGFAPLIVYLEESDEALAGLAKLKLLPAPPG
jgi:hypothetical protein